MSDLILTCHSCGLTMQATTEAELVELGREHAAAHGHVPPEQHIRARIARQNRTSGPT